MVSSLQLAEARQAYATTYRLKQRVAYIEHQQHNMQQHGSTSKYLNSTIATTNAPLCVIFLYASSFVPTLTKKAAAKPYRQIAKMMMKPLPAQAQARAMSARAANARTHRSTATTVPHAPRSVGQSTRHERKPRHVRKVRNQLEPAKERVESLG